MSDRIAAAVAELADAIRADVLVKLAPVANAPDRLLGIDLAADTLGIGRSATYDLLGAGRLRSVKIGRRRLVPSRAIREYIDQAGSRSAAR